MKGVNVRIMLLLSALAVFYSCEDRLDNFHEFNIHEFDNSLIPGNYLGVIDYLTPNSQGYLVYGDYNLEYKITILGNGSPFTFVFDTNFIVQVPNIEIFTNERYYKFAGHDRLSIDSIQSENYVKLTEIGNPGDPGKDESWKFYNYFEQVSYYDGNSFNLLLQDLDSTYVLDIRGGYRID
jgi:hypothetical protein